VEENQLHLDWRHWFDRWEAMQNCYIPHRLDRFDVMMKVAGLPTEKEVQILDLGCGPDAETALRVIYSPI